MVRVAEDPTPRPLRVFARREALALLGAAGFTAVAAACSGDSASSAGGNGGRRGSSSSATTSPGAADSTATTAPNPTSISCVLTPEMTEGPYYLTGEANRRDITEGRPGTPMKLVLTVASVSGCKPLSRARVDIWHADASGNYSGFGSTTSNKTFLRGVQTTDANGVATFSTIYPGWYQGRAVHIHVKVDAGGSAVHTGQLFFDDSVNATVFGTSPYNTRGSGWMRNSQDGIYSNGGSQSLVQLAKEASGYTGTLTLGVRT
jgi:protocatechuate 3,4-dioxygenase beta subunit